MTLQQLASLILAPSFAVTMTAILRKLFPRIDGPALVWGVAVLLSTGGSVLLALTAPYTAATIATAVVSGIVTGLMGCGAVQAMQDAAKKGQTPEPAKLPLDRDTTPNS
jgi:sorbitol-specific phosphotransferase system component IIC